jgi:hypothetical protein
MLRIAWACTAISLLNVAACRGHGKSAEAAVRSARDVVAEFAPGRFEWVEAECNDGALDLAALGFERSLSVQAQAGSLLLTFVTRLATRGCAQTSVWQAKPANEAELWHLDPQALVGLPPGAACGAVEREAIDGSLRIEGDELEVITHRSPWCRGFDARFVYRRVETRALSPQEVVIRYIAHFDRGDADSVARLFEANASMVEPFTRTPDGSYARHEGREALRGWYASAFSGASWHAMRLLGLETRDQGQLVANWEYMDANLAEPLRGRNLFLIAEGEIYETEVQLVTDPVRKSSAEASAAPVVPASREVVP